MGETAEAEIQKAMNTIESVLTPEQMKGMDGVEDRLHGLSKHSTIVSGNSLVHVAGLLRDHFREGPMKDEFLTLMEIADEQGYFSLVNNGVRPQYAVSYEAIRAIVEGNPVPPPDVSYARAFVEEAAARDRT